MKSKFFALIAIGTSFIAGAMLAPVIAETSDDVAREARNFRIQAYLTHHGDRAAYDRYRKIGDRTSQAWIDAKMPAERASETAAWFRAARESLAGGGVIPGELDFSTPVKTAIAAVPVEQPQIVASPAPAVQPAPVVTPAVDPVVTPIVTPEPVTENVAVEIPMEASESSSDQSTRGPGAAIWRAFARAISSAE